MTPDEWNKSDSFVLELFSSTNPMDRGFEGLEPLLEIFESLDEELRPDMMSILDSERKYSRKALRKRLNELRGGDTITGFTLVRSLPPEVRLSVTCRTDEEGPYCCIELVVAPLSFLREPSRASQRADHLVSFVRAISSRLPLSQGLGHSSIDFHMGSDPLAQLGITPPQMTDAYWLNIYIYGPQRVEAIGRQRLLSTPAALIEPLPGGAVLWLTRPTPADFDSEEARLAQARALVHLRPELPLDSTLSTLRQRSLVFSPIPVEFDPDVADILSREVDFRGLRRKRQEVEHFNHYRPPAVSEWVPASQAPAADVENVQAAIDTYEGLYAEQLIALFHADIPEIMDGTLEALPRLDWRLWHFDWGKKLSASQVETLVPALGAWLGRYLVGYLGGRWVPRRKLEEAAVIVGDRAWLPFLRARHALQGQQAPLDYSCSQFFRFAQRLAPPSSSAAP